MRLLSAVSGALLAAIGIVSEAHACACAGGEPELWAGRADAVFLGRPVGGGPSLFSERGGIATTFAVDSVWKGDVRRRVVVVTDLSSCGGSFASGETYLVFARRNHQGRLKTGACTGTGLAINSARAFAVLGAGAPPRPRSWLPLAAALGGAVAAVMLSLGFAKRRRRGRGEERQHTESAFRMVVANIYSLPDGPVVTGRIESGRVRVGDNLVLSGALGRFPVQVTSIQKFRQVLTEAAAGPEPVGIMLSGIEQHQIRNRDLLVPDT